MLRDPGAPGLSPPRVAAVAKAIACELPAQRGEPLARYSVADIQRVLVAEGVVPRISVAPLWRWLDADELRPWRHRSWIFPRDPDSLRKAGIVLDLYQGLWEGQPLGPREYVLSADEKTSIQARGRSHPSAPPAPGQPQRVEHEYDRGGALAYLAAWDVFAARLVGHPAPKTGIHSFNHLVTKVMTQSPYAAAERVFWIVDNGSSHHPATFPVRLRAAYPQAVAVHVPIHASWLNQIEVIFSIIQRKVLTPNDFANLEAIIARLTAFEARLSENPKPIAWRFTRAKLLEKWSHKHDTNL
jgi:hypothetical protein